MKSSPHRMRAMGPSIHRRRRRGVAGALLLLGAVVTPGEGHAQVSFTQSAHVCRWTGRADAPTILLGCTPACPDDMSMVDNCYNRDAPPAPSIMRPLESAGILPESTTSGPYAVNTQDSYWEYVGPVYGELGTIHPIDQTMGFFPHGKKNPGMTSVLPMGRSSNDGRLQLIAGNWGFPAFAVFRPEALDYDFVIQSNPLNPSAAVSPLGPKGHLSTLMYQNPVDTSLVFTKLQNAARHGQGIFIHNTVCDDSSPAWAPPAGRTRNPIACRAPRTKTDEHDEHYEEGDCYQLSVLFQGTEDWKATSWEMRSNAFTVFVPHPKRDGTGLGSDAQEPWIYPRQNLPYSASTAPILPALAHFQGEPAIGEIESTYRTANGIAPGAILTPAQHMGVTNAYRNQITHDCYTPSTTPRPRWCEYLDNQKHRNVFTLHKETGPVETWSGNPAEHALFEPTITGDGRLLLVNLAGFGIAYSYNNLGACRADGFENMHHVSEMPWDPEINTRYPIAQNQVGSGAHVCGTSRYFRDTKGRDIHWRKPISGAYPWIDREGRNIFFAAVNEARDGWKATSQSDCTPGVGTCSDCAHFLNPDVRAGKAVVALGAWTQGKMVHLDNGLNFTDWGNIPGGSDPFSSVSFQMALYQDNPATPTVNESNLTVRPHGSTSILSAENQYNDYDALSPVLPFDVVWDVSSNNQHNAEVAFDDYLSNDALVVAHMNAALDYDEYGRTYPDDGFVATRPEVFVRDNTDKDHRGGYYFARTPRLQNAATSDAFFSPGAVEPPSAIRLRGGARIEPVAEGGVLGKGVYLDGKNDFIDVGGIHTSEDDWYHGLWLDSREDRDDVRRVVMTFTDASYIEMSRREIVVFDAHASGPGARQVIDITRLGLRKGRYYHLGFTTTTEGAERVVRFIVNGTRLGNGEVRFPLTSSAPCDRGFAIHLPSWGEWGWYVVGAVPNPLPEGSPGGLLPWKGWVDELRTYRVKADQAIGTYFDEIACNFALGTLVNVHDDEADATDPSLGPLYATAYGHSLVSTPPWFYPVPYVGPSTMMPMTGGSFGGGTCPYTDACDAPEAFAGTCATSLTCDAQGQQLDGKCEPWEDCAPLVNQAFGPSPWGQCKIGEECDLLGPPMWQVNVEPGFDPGPGTLPLNPDPGPVADPPWWDSSGSSTAFDPGVPEIGTLEHEYMGHTVMVCEQMKLVTYKQALDFPPQGHERVCIDRVHRNRNPDPALASRCMRRKKLGVASLPLWHSSPRPSFSSVPFCKTCHSASAHLTALKDTALSAGTVPRQQDKRRQPLDVPAVLFGRTPTTDGFTAQSPLVSPPPALPNAGLPLDQFFDHLPKIAP